MIKEIKKEEIKVGDKVLINATVVNIRHDGDFDIKIAGDGSTKVYVVSGEPNTFKIINLPPDRITIPPTAKERNE